MCDLTTLPLVKAHLGITDSDEDTLLAQLISEVSEAVKGYTKRGNALCESASVTEYHSGDDSDSLFLRIRPATDITSVHVDSQGYFGKGTASGGVFGSETAWTEGEDFVLTYEAADEKNAAKLVSLNRVWPWGVGNIKVVYVAGYSTIPGDLQLAVHMLVAASRQAAEKGAAGPLASETFGKYTYRLLAGSALGTASEVATIRGIVGRYREVM